MHLFLLKYICIFSDIFYSYSNHTSVHSFSFNPYSYAFLVEDGIFKFRSSEDLLNLRNITRIPVVLLDWSIGNLHVSKLEAQRKHMRLEQCMFQLCPYIRKCKNGFDGNPSIPFKWERLPSYFRLFILFFMLLRVDFFFRIQFLFAPCAFFSKEELKNKIILSMK